MISSSYIYLHGLASSPDSLKAQYLQSCFAQAQISLSIPDLNQGDFADLTLTRQLRQVAAEFAHLSVPITLIGSSLGGLTAAWLGEQYPQVTRLVLLAPAFSFISNWLKLLGETQRRQWQESGQMLVYHYGEKRSLPLNYQFVTDTSQYQEEQLQRQVSTLILHGQSDEVVPIDHSRNYTRQRSWVTLRELDSDHGMADVLPQIWQEIKHFCQINA